ncbi:MAG: TonB-dependent receptor plug domain-containing protein, partial [Cyclobacteriaceae bacterium]|nr:TonB-dependent receptor plug domain-containing protein [Cyclobacteriaceae bacterium]
MKKKLFTRFIYVMKIGFQGLLLIAMLMNVAFAENGNAQLRSLSEVYIRLELKDVEIKRALDLIEQKTTYEFAYDRRLLKANSLINLSYSKASVAEVLGEIARQAGVNFRRVNNDIDVTLVRKEEVPEVTELIEDIPISGTVTDENGEPLPGVSITVKGTTQGVVTDLDGNYNVQVAEGAVLVFSFIGYVTIERAISAQTVINISMKPDITELSEVIVTAFGIEREKKALGYAAQEVGQKDLSQARDLNVANYLKGKVAGVQVSNSASGTGGSKSVTIRGYSSLTENQPLYVVDGIPLNNDNNDGGGSKTSGLWGEKDYGDGIGNINPQDVESMTVLKGPNATALYGSRGSNGVIIITTKSGKNRKGIGVELNSNTSMEKINLIPRTQNMYATGYEGTNLYGPWRTINGKDYEVLSAWHGDSWGPPLDGRRTVVDPF